MASEKNTEKIKWFKSRAVARIVAVVLVLVAMCAVLVSAGYALKRFLLTDNPHFLCRNIDFEPTPHFSLKGMQTLLEEMGDEKGCILSRSNLLKVDIAGIQKRLASYPIVRNVAVSRVMPGTLKIEMTERMPFAFISNGKKIDALIDRDGVVYPYYDMRGVPGTLPYIMNVRNVKRLPFGEVTQDKPLLAALAFMENAYTHSQVKGAEFEPNIIMLNYELERLECHIKGIPGNKIFAEDTVICVPFEAEHMADAMDRLYTILALKIKGGETISFADVTLEKNVNTLQ